MAPGARVDRANELTEFRQDLYSCLTRWPDALFELTDAALCAPGAVGSVPTLSLEPCFTRSHGSLYKALLKGRIDDDTLRQLLVEHRPKDWPEVFAVDASVWERCDAECSPERGFYYSASKHSAGQPIVAGWSFQWISQLSFSPDSWTAPLDVARITPTQDATDATIDQVSRLVERLGDDGDVALFVFDAGYDPIALTFGLSGTRAQVLCRIHEDRVFYADAPSRPRRPRGTGGRPPRHGRRMKCSDRRTWATPSERLVTSDPRYGTVTVTAWHGLHPRLVGRGRWVRPRRPAHREGHRHLRRGRAFAQADGRGPRRPCGSFGPVRTSPTSTCAGGLTCGASTSSTPSASPRTRWGGRRRHCRRLHRRSVGRGSSLPCSPSSDFARGRVDDLRLPWERPREPDQLTPARVRRGFRRLRATIGTPASPPKYTKSGPGRPKGTRRPPRTRYPAVKKAA